MKIFARSKIFKGKIFGWGPRPLTSGYPVGKNKFIYFFFASGTAKAVARWFFFISARAAHPAVAALRTAAMAAVLPRRASRADKPDGAATRARRGKFYFCEAKIIFLEKRFSKKNKIAKFFAFFLFLRSKNKKMQKFCRDHKISGGDAISLRKTRIRP